MEVAEISRIFDNVTNRDITEIHFKSKHNQSIKFETEKEVLNISRVFSLCFDTDWSTSMSRLDPRNCSASSLMPLRTSSSHPKPPTRGSSLVLYVIRAPLIYI